MYYFRAVKYINKNIMESNFLKVSENANVNYLAIISKVTNIKPIENADRLCTTVLNGYNIIVQKNGSTIAYLIKNKYLCSEMCKDE